MPALPAPGAGEVAPLNRTLEQELNALLRGASLECLVCGEFVLHVEQGGIFCPECGSGLDVAEAAEPAVPVSRSGGR